MHMTEVWVAIAEKGRPVRARVRAPFRRRHEKGKFKLNSLARLRHHVDERRLAALDYSNSALNSRCEICGIGNRPLGVHTHALRQFCEIDVRFGDCGADSGSSCTPIVPISHGWAMHDFLSVRS